MRLSVQPVQVATGSDEEGLLVFDDDGRLVAVLTRLSELHDKLSGHWFLEVGFGRIDGPNHPTFTDIEGAKRLDRAALAYARDLPMNLAARVQRCASMTPWVSSRRSIS